MGVRVGTTRPGTQDGPCVVTSVVLVVVGSTSVEGVGGPRSPWTHTFYVPTSPSYNHSTVRRIIIIVAVTITVTYPCYSLGSQKNDELSATKVYVKE